MVSEYDWQTDKEAFLGKDTRVGDDTVDSELRRRRGEFGPLAAEFAQLAARLFSAGTAADVLETILQAAASLFPEADLVSIALHTEDRLTTPVATHDLAARVDALQFAHGEGPYFDATRLDGTGTAADDDLSVSTQWPRFGPAAAGLGVRSVVALGLLPGAGGARPGALTFYAYEPRILATLDRDIGLLLAAHAGAALSAISSVEAADLRVANLERALLSRDVIGQAKGMLMERRGISAEEAFDILRASSQRLNIKLSRIAEAVITHRFDP
ncbi:ANTAR domain-containing protein [Pseudonocardia sp. NPDC049635]|uniref:ANTAR domain-containing protein n=1 Tax=Pseudonocardia sp. NPDC049635 TaxID=3155506 RepID=UPI0033FC19AF